MPATVPGAADQTTTPAVPHPPGDRGAAPAAAPPEPGAVEPATLLVVNDDFDLRELVGLRLWRAGFTVLGTSGGDHAVDAAVMYLPDLIVMDVAIPGGDGLAVCRRLRDDPRTARIPIILLTARSHPAFVLEGFAAGATSYLAKPFNPAELVAEINNLLTDPAA